jgi:hypothetical protein
MEDVMKTLAVIQKTDNRLAALRMALGHICLQVRGAVSTGEGGERSTLADVLGDQVEQAQAFMGHLLPEVTDVVKALAIILPYMAGPQHAQVAPSPGERSSAVD